MDILDDEILSLWFFLNKNNVKYIMIGGFAANLNGFKRFTADLDILIEDTLENRKNLRKALKEAKIGDFKPLETMEFIPGITSITLDSGISLDLFTELVGIDNYTFQKCYELAPIAGINNIKIRFLHINQLIDNKKFVNRAKDKIDVIELEKIKQSNHNK